MDLRRRKGGPEKSAVDPAVQIRSHALQKQERALAYRQWMNDTTANVAKAWCTFNAIALCMDAAVLHPPITPVAAIHVLAYSVPSILLLRWPQLTEVCFVWTNCCRILVALAVGTSYMPLNPTLNLLQKLNIDKLVEIGLVPFFEHMRPGWMLAIRGALVLGYALCYTRLSHPFPWLTALLVNSLAAGVHMWMHRRYCLLYSKYLDRVTQPLPQPAGKDQLLPSVQSLQLAASKCAMGRQAAPAADGGLEPHTALTTDPMPCTSQLYTETSAISAPHALPCPHPAQQPGSAGGSHAGSALGPESLAHLSCRLQLLQPDPCTQQQLAHVLACLRSRRPKYRSLFRHSKATLKIPCESGPSALSGVDVRAELHAVLQTRRSDVEVLSVVMCAGCILLIADLQASVRPASQPAAAAAAAAAAEAGGGLRSGLPSWHAGMQGLGRALAEAANEWLLSLPLVAELPASKPVTLQVGDELYTSYLGRLEGQAQWDVQGPFEVPALLHGARIAAASPSTLLPTPERPATHTAAAPPPTAAAPAASTDDAHKALAAVRVLVSAPLEVDVLVGQDLHAQGGDADGVSVPALQVMACTGSGYVALQLVQAKRVAHPGGGTVLEVDVLLPLVAADPPPSSLLRLELWHGHALLDCTHMLLLAASTDRALHEELLQRLPWGVLGCEDTADYVADLGLWLQHCRGTPARPASPVRRCSQANSCSNFNGSSTPACSQAAASNPPLPNQLPAGLHAQHGQMLLTLPHAASPAWASGAALLRQAVLWGLPHLATRVFDHLATLPCAPAAPLAHLAQVTDRPGTHAAVPPLLPAQEGGGQAGVGPSPSEHVDVDVEDLGGLLHLALLSPAPAHMLRVVLGWQRCTCRGGGEEGGEAATAAAAGGLARAWQQPNALGLTPLDILCGAGGEVLQAVLEEPGARAAVLEATCTQPAAGGAAHDAAGAATCAAQPAAGRGYGGGGGDRGRFPPLPLASNAPPMQQPAP